MKSININFLRRKSSKDVFTVEKAVEVIVNLLDEKQKQQLEVKFNEQTATFQELMSAHYRGFYTKFSMKDTKVCAIGVWQSNSGLFLNEDTKTKIENPEWREILFKKFDFLFTKEKPIKPPNAFVRFLHKIFDFFIKLIFK